MTINSFNDLLHTLIAEADEAALANVRARRGGPFGALLYVGDQKTGALTRIGEPAGNAVLETGLATAHAEDRLLSSENIAALRAALTPPPEDHFVLMVSSAESCPACLAKLEVLARILVHDGLLLPGRFIFAYGASYAETRDVAGFNDDAYHEDFARTEGRRLVGLMKAERGRAPPKVKEMFAGGALAVLVLPGGKMFAGRDERAEHFTLIPEIAAVNEACRWQKNRGEAEAWNLKGATLYSFTTDPGPMAYAACQWANVRTWIAVGGGRESAEAPGIRNEALFRAVAQRPYNGAGAAVKVVRIQPFANRAQHEWKELLGKGAPGLANYNGIAAAGEE